MGVADATALVNTTSTRKLWPSPPDEGKELEPANRYTPACAGVLMPLVVIARVNTFDVAGKRELESKTLTVYVRPASNCTLTGTLRQPTDADGLTATRVMSEPVLDQTDALVTPEFVAFW